MPETEIREKLQALHINVQAVIQLRSKRRDQDPEKDRPLTPHFIVLVARGPDLVKVRTFTDLYGLQVKVETYNAPKGQLKCNCCQRFGHTQSNCSYAPRRAACGDAQPSEKCITPKQQFKCCSCGGNWRLLQSERKGSSAERMASPRACQRPNQLWLSLLPNRGNWALAGTTLSEVAALSKLRLRQTLPPLNPTQQDGPNGRQPKTGGQRKPACPEVSVENPNHRVPNRLTLHLPPPTETVTDPADGRSPGEPSY
jgi:hypothetical protein